METVNIKQKVFELASGVAEDEGLELVEVVLSGRGKMLLKIVIDKESGVAISDCERMSRRLEALLDVEDLMKCAYMLEVSSPGIDRPLAGQRDFEKNIGKLARVVTNDTIDGQSFFIGRIIDVGESWIRLKMEKAGGQKKALTGKGRGEEKEIFVPLEKISRAQLEIEIK